MAFNFNWSPLTADASFYTRAQELLTDALNKAPKPPIIVDDILVNELNLGSVPPDLEILEIGDLAEDRFRGIFKMCYSGDAFLTLKTRVQANPLNTYLSTKPSFASPTPLAAASSLTIPLQITLSEIKLSAFIILVFSRQKGLTLVFRNDPLESLKVSSTFDSIPFVRDYLQKEIEGQLRTLLMDDLPAIIHRLSLRLWVPEYRAQEDEELARRSGKSESEEEKPVDPLASPPQDPVDISGRPLDASELASLSLDDSSEKQSLFSQKNLLRLAALTDSNRTLSLFTPGIRDVAFRAWAGPTERGERRGTTTPATPIHPGISRMHSQTGDTSTTYTFSATTEGRPQLSRPGLSSYGSTATGLGGGAGKHGKSHGGRKRKHRIVNLRAEKPGFDELESVSGDGSTYSATTSSAASELEVPASPSEHRDGEVMTPPRTPPRPQHKIRLRPRQDSIDIGDITLQSRDLTPRPPQGKDFSTAVRTSTEAPSHGSLLSEVPNPALLNHDKALQIPSPEPASTPATIRRPKLRATPYLPASSSQYPQEWLANANHTSITPFPYLEAPLNSGGILEQAWMMKLASEIARKAQEHKGNLWNQDQGLGLDERAAAEEGPPPAYES